MNACVRVNGNNKRFDIPLDNYSEITIEHFKEIIDDRIHI